MFDPKSTANINYIKGFDHGCDYIVAEIERYITTATSHDALVLVELLKRLKTSWPRLEDKPHAN